MQIVSVMLIDFKVSADSIQWRWHNISFVKALNILIWKTCDSSLERKRSSQFVMFVIFLFTLVQTEISQIKFNVLLNLAQTYMNPNNWFWCGFFWIVWWNCIFIEYHYQVKFEICQALVYDQIPTKVITFPSAVRFS